MAVSKEKKALAGLLGLLIALVGLGVALAKCRSCRVRLQKMMMTKMQKKMPEMMNKFFGKLGKEDQLEMATHCKTMFSDIEDKLKNEPT